MKKNFCLVNWLMIIIMLIGGVVVNSQPANAENDLVPYLVSFDNNGKVIQKERLTHLVANGGTDTTFYDQKGHQLKKKDMIRWFPKFSRSLEQEVVSAKWMGRRSMYAALSASGYNPGEADSLSRAIEKVVNSKQDSRPMISAIMAASPNNQLLAAYNDRLLEVERDLALISNNQGSNVNNDYSYESAYTDSILALIIDYTDNFTDYSEAIAAIDEHLSTTRGKLWEKIKAKHGVVINHSKDDEYADRRIPDRFDDDDDLDQPEEPVRPKKQHKHRVAQMPTPRRF